MLSQHKRFFSTLEVHIEMVEICVPDHFQTGAS
jgi:hypothetical protein